MRTTSRLVGLGFASAAVLLAQGAAALPPPMTEQELMDASDLVIDGVGISIECDGPPIADENMISTFYLTRVFPSQTYKGVAMRSIDVRGQQVEWIVAVAGPWFPDAIPVGWSGRLYLVENSDGTYSEVWWNGVEEDQTSAPEALPDCGAAGAGGAGGTGGSGGSSAEGGTAGAGAAADTGGGAGDGTGGAAGTLAGGSGGSGTGGSETGGEAGTNSGGSGGGSAGVGTGGAAGTLAGGSGGSGTGGSETGGEAGTNSGGSGGGSAGVGTGGAAGTLAGGSGGSGTGGSETGGEAETNSAGTGGDTGSGGDSGDDAGCACSAAGKSAPNSGLALMLGAALCAAGLRRTRRSPPPIE